VDRLSIIHDRNTPSSTNSKKSASRIDGVSRLPYRKRINKFSVNRITTWAQESAAKHIAVRFVPDGNRMPPGPSQGTTMPSDKATKGANTPKLKVQGWRRHARIKSATRYKTMREWIVHRRGQGKDIALTYLHMTSSS
jgi:hypothetical protein